MQESVTSCCLAQIWQFEPMCNGISLTKTQQLRKKFRCNCYQKNQTKSKGNVIVILHNFSFQLLSPHWDVLLQKIYQKDKCCS